MSRSTNDSCQANGDNPRAVETSFLGEADLPDEPLSAEKLAKGVVGYRSSMAKFLQASLAIMNDMLSSGDFNNRFDATAAIDLEKDPILTFRIYSQLLMKKARFHVFAALRANETSNIHSVAVQMRPALECAGQIVLLVRNLFDRSRNGERALEQYLDRDYYQIVLRLSKGQVDHANLLKDISRTKPVRTEPLREIRSLRESEKVTELEFGCAHYAHLSECFYHSKLEHLKGISYYGGVRSNNTINDQYSFAALLDYLVHQMLVMAMYAGMCPGLSDGNDRRLDRAIELMEKKRAASEHYRDTLLSMARRCAELRK